MQEIFKDYDIGRKLNFHYANASPFPNIVIDDFINPSVAMTCYQELCEFKDWGWDPTKYSAAHQVNKFFAPWSDESFDSIKNNAPTVFAVLQHFNSEPFVKSLGELAGIKGMTGDPHFVGGGIHKITTGGRLSLHLDYNSHPSTKKYRILNLLLYLNPLWENEWGGHLELWDMKNKICAHKIAPNFNRAAIFTLSDTSVHGHPHPLKCPEHISRYSLALYYFVEAENLTFSERTSAVWTEV